MKEFPAIYIPTHDVDAIVESVEKIFENPSLRDELSHKVYSYSTALKPETYKEKLVGYLSKI